MNRLGACLVGGCFVISIAACAPATQGAFVPRLDLGLRSSRTGAQKTGMLTPASAQRWDLTVFANLAWSSRRSVALIPSRMELSPDVWIAPCADQDCLWDESELDASAPVVDGVTP